MTLQELINKVQKLINDEADPNTEIRRKSEIEDATYFPIIERIELIKDKKLQEWYYQGQKTNMLVEWEYKGLSEGKFTFVLIE